MLNFFFFFFDVGEQNQTKIVSSEKQINKNLVKQNNLGVIIVLLMTR